MEFKPNIKTRCQQTLEIIFRVSPFTLSFYPRQNRNKQNRYVTQRYSFSIHLLLQHDPPSSAALHECIETKPDTSAMTSGTADASKHRDPAATKVPVAQVQVSIANPGCANW